MKYQAQHDLIDPEVPSPEVASEADGGRDTDILNDAYVIGEHGNTVQAPAGRAATKSRSGPKRWAQAFGAVLGALFVLITAWNLSRLLGGPPPPPRPSAFQVKQALYLGVMKIDAYRRVHGVTPRSLAEAGLLETGGYGYQRIDPLRYVVSFQDNGPRLEYDSNISKDRFFGPPQDILTMGVSK
jgi:hypothetical protein